MMKKIGIAFLVMVFSSSLFAENYSVGQKFLGIEVGSAKIKAGVYPGGVEDPLLYDGFFEGSDVTFGLRFGAQNDEYRTMILFDYYDNEDEDQTYEVGLVSLDYFILSSDAGQVSVKPFIGAHVGYMNYESSYIDENDFIYGGQAGIVANLSENIDVDLSYRYSLAYEADSFDHFAVIMVGLNYLY